jgi:type II secretory pathway pseudopilin PulG
MRMGCSAAMRRECGLRVGAGGAGVVEGQGEDGFMLVGLVVAIFLVLLVLSIAAPKVAEDLKRQREVEAVHRGNEYVRAIQLYYRKTGSYPATLEQLEKTNNIRFLRERFVDPMTGKADWRLIHVGEAKTTVKGFFGQPLTGMAPGLGSAAGMASQGPAGAGAAGSSSPSAFGSSSPGAYGSSSAGGSSFGSSSFGSSSSGSSFGSSSPSAFGSSSPGGLGSSSASSTSTPGGSSTGTDSSGTGSSGSSNGIGSQSATSFTGSAAPFVGVGIPKAGDSIIDLNQQTTYNTWEFIYDPRIEQLKAKGNVLGGGASSASAGSLGSASGMSSGVGGTGTSGTGSGFGSPSNSGFGSPSGSGFGSGSGSGFGSSSPGSSSPTTPSTPPQ